jgi:glycosyltransferase involved in cell wall biosynthesis
LSISVIIPAWNAGRTISECLEAIAGQTVPPIETIVVDDCSSDDTPIIASSLGVKVLRLSKNGGPAAARNLGAKTALGDIVLFLDADVIIPETLIDCMSHHFNDSSVSAVQTIYTPKCPGAGIVTQYQNFYYHHSLGRLKSGKVAIFATWCAAVRLPVFLELGGFNECIPEPTVEDEEFGYAVADSGGVIYLDTSLQVTHLARYSHAAFSTRRLRMAVAQAKSGWRQVKQRLLARYINVHETGTHHSRWVVLSIILTSLAWCALLSAPITGRAGLLLFPGLLIPALLCHTGFFSAALRHFPGRVIPGFAFMCVLDMTILGLGLARGTIEFISGKRY